MFGKDFIRGSGVHKCGEIVVGSRFCGRKMKREKVCETKAFLLKRLSYTGRTNEPKEIIKYWWDQILGSHSFNTQSYYSDTVMQCMNMEEDEEEKKKCQSITNNLKQWTKSITKIKFIRLKCVGYDGEKMCAHTKEKPSNKSPSKSAMNEIVVYPPAAHTHAHRERTRQRAK